VFDLLYIVKFYPKINLDIGILISQYLGKHVVEFLIVPMQSQLDSVLEIPNAFFQNLPNGWKQRPKRMDSRTFMSF